MKRQKTFFRPFSMKTMECIIEIVIRRALSENELKNTTMLIVPEDLETQSMCSGAFSRTVDLGSVEVNPK